MPSTTLDRVIGLRDFAPLWRYHVEMPSFGPSITLPSVHVSEGSFPFQFVNQNPREHSGTHVFYPDTNTVDAMSMIFREVEDYPVLKYLNFWYNRVVNPDLTYNHSDYYKRQIKVTMLNNQGTPRLVVVYYGAFPTRIEALDVGNDDFCKISTTFSVDRAVIDSVGSTIPVEEPPHSRFSGNSQVLEDRGNAEGFGPRDAGAGLIV